jgi:hypothetical protein
MTRLLKELDLTDVKGRLTQFLVNWKSMMRSLKAKLLAEVILTDGI